MKVVKKELTPRVFIPYEVTITIDSAEEHKALKKELTDLKYAASGAWYKFQRGYGSVIGLVNEIEKHL